MRTWAHGFQGKKKYFPRGFLWSCPDNQTMNVLLAVTHMCLWYTPSCFIPLKTDKCPYIFIYPTPLHLSKCVLKYVYLHMCIYILQIYIRNNDSVALIQLFRDGKNWLNNLYTYLCVQMTVEWMNRSSGGFMNRWTKCTFLCVNKIILNSVLKE